ncbi:MAG: hypothetical protein ABR589_04385 [Chthoniobacterales bacterium]
MRRVVCHLALVFFLVGPTSAAEAQVQRPQFRPAVLGSAPDSLVNRIDTKELLNQGQKDGAVMFCSVVSKTGEAVTSWTYRAIPGSDALEREVTKRLQETKFAPAIYNYQPVSVLISGTAVFSVVEAKPRLRIFLNQDSRELKEAKDFIAPQPVFGADSKFDGLQAPEGSMRVPLTAIVDVMLKVDGHGKLLDLRVLAEDPPLLGFGAAALADFREAKFIPAFRDGDATESETVFPVCYKPAE